MLLSRISVALLVLIGPPSLSCYGQDDENIVFEGAEAAVARINLDKAPSRTLVTKLQESNADIIELSLLTL